MPKDGLWVAAGNSDLTDENKKNGKNFFIKI